jgi:hypothetical protein
VLCDLETAKSKKYKKMAGVKIKAGAETTIKLIKNEDFQSTIIIYPVRDKIQPMDKNQPFFGSF